MIIVLNNKCNLTKDEFLIYQKKLEQIEDENQIILCPSNIYLSLVNSKKIELGSQNVGNYNMGSYTGEISAKQLASFNVKYCIVGHSERRKYQQETNNDIKNKIINLLNNNIVPIYCIGETLEEKNENKVAEVLTKELREVLSALDEIQKKKLIIAYEPIWAIGTGQIPTVEEIEYAINIIKKFLPDNKIIYGGSATENNVDIINNVKDINGYLLGGLSLSIDNLKIFLEKLEK